EGRLGKLEQQLAPLAEREAELAASLGGMRTTLDGARAEVSERLREMTMRLTASEGLQEDLAGVHQQLDSLSRDQVSRSLEIGKLQDRLVRLEMRMGDVLKEQG